MDNRIYICTHKAFYPPDKEGYIPLNVGSVLRPDLGYERDDRGDNISGKNTSFCELTGVYYIWKNVSCDVVGICHYRRYFVDNGDFISADRIEEILSSYDVILPRSGFTKYTDLNEHYRESHYMKDMNKCREVLARKYPGDVKAFDHVMKCNLFSIGNMIITKKSIFDEYCEWLFDILFEVEKETDLSGYDTFQGRLFGYLSERLIRVFFMNRKYRIKEMECQGIDPVDEENAKKQTDLIRNMVEKIESDVVTLYKSGIMEDLVREWPEGPDFEGKLPVFVCWWQGFDKAPELVRCCRKSLEMNILPGMKIFEITEENVSDYVLFPKHIKRFYDMGAISKAHLSDILRSMLLYRYGGIWIDATCFLAKEMPEEYIKSSFFTIRSEKKRWQPDIVQGRWDTSLMKAEPGNILAGFMMNALIYYWLITDRLIDPHLLDYVINEAYNKLSGIRDMIDAVPCSGPERFDLQQILNRRYRENRWEELTKDTSVFRLACQADQAVKTITGEDTFFGHMLKQTGVVTGEQG